MEERRQPSANERRSSVRYPLQMKVRFSSQIDAHVVEGSGQTVDFSSSGILVDCQDQRIARVGAPFEAFVEWPALMNGRIPLELVVMGRVVRAETRRFAATLVRYRFQVMKRGPGSSFTREAQTNPPAEAMGLRKG